MQYNTTRSITENQDNKTLKDITKSGKQRPWREKKIDNVRFCCKVRKSSNFLFYHFSVRLTS
ncbi:replication protein [Staphylococcus sp. 7716]|nr:replication protein [Staphylococcus sp. 7716]